MVVPLAHVKTFEFIFILLVQIDPILFIVVELRRLTRHLCLLILRVALLTLTEVQVVSQLFLR